MVATFSFFVCSNSSATEFFTTFVNMKITIDNAIPFIAGVFEPYAEVQYLAGERFDADSVRDSDALIIRTRTKCNAALLDGSRVRMIATATIGYDHIDLDYCRAHDIEVATAAGCNSRGVLQWVAAALKSICERDGSRPADHCLGVVGVGNIGRLVEEYGRRWGFRVLCCDPPRARAEGGDFRSIDVLTQSCDIITFHVPLIRQGEDCTVHLAGERFFSQLTPNAVVLNASRGEVVDNDRLSRAIAEGRCSAYLDVWENEPTLNRELLSQVVAATPHVAGYSAQGKANATAMSVQAVARKFGLPLGDYFPAEVERVEPQPIEWAQMCATIDRYCDLASESRALREHPDRFEQLRNEYRYREEYF